MVSRVESDTCRSNVIDHFCAYIFDPFGMCVPPNLLIPGQITNENSNLFLNDLVFPKVAEDNRFVPGRRDPNDDLIPVRLGFIILVHKDPDAVVQLVEALFRSLLNKDPGTLRSFKFNI